MAAQKEYLLSLGHLTSPEKNTFTEQRKHYIKKSFDRPMELQADHSTLQNHQHLRMMYLQQRWLQLKEREQTAQQHNRQLLQQFDQAQETLREMLACNAAMKTIRMEYERYLEESAPRWQQQLKEKTQAAQKKKQRLKDYLAYLNNVEEGLVTKSSANQSSQGPATASQKNTAPHPYADYNQNDSSHLSYPQSSWLTHSKFPAGMFPVGAPYQLHTSSTAPQAFHQPVSPHPYQLPVHHLTSTPDPHHNHHWPRQDPAGCTQPSYPWLWGAEIPLDSKALWAQLNMEEPPPGSMAAQTVVEEDNNLNMRERSHLCQELDVKPVRLTGGNTDSSESGRDSSLASREKRGKKERRGRPQHTSSDEERYTSETSSAIVIPSGRMTKSPESDSSSKKSRTSSRKTRRSEGSTVLSPQSGKVGKDKIKRDDSEMNERLAAEELGSSSEESMSEKVENDSKTEICGAESGSQRENESGSESTKNEKGVADETEEEESSSTEEEEEERQKHLGAGSNEDKENSQKDEEQEDRDVEHDDDDEKKITTEEEEEGAAEEETEDDEEKSDRVNNKEHREQESSSSGDEEVNEDKSKGCEEKIEEIEEGESEEEEADGSDEGGEDRDSDDSIISPPEKRSKQMQVIPEESNEDDEGDDEGEEKKDDEDGESEEEEDSSNEFSEDDIEDLLAPQEQMTNKAEEKDMKANDKPKALCDKMQIFQVEPDGLKSDHQSDSDEFDHFYD